MHTAYSGSADLGGVHVTVTIDNVDTSKWIGTVTGARAAEPFEDGLVTVRLLDQPRPGWTAQATVERLPGGSVRLIGTRSFYSSR